MFDGFGDVNTGDWFYEPVGKMSAQSIMTGMSAGTFGPAVNLSRAQFATILYRMEGSPEVAYTHRFPDVPENQFYTSPVMWASLDSVGIVGGYANGQYGPADNITREQMALMMWRYAKYKEYSVNVTDSDALSSYPDKGNVSSFASDAMKWAVGIGLITGTQGKLDPQGEASRAQCATIIMRFLEYYE